MATKTHTTAQNHLQTPMDNLTGGQTLDGKGAKSENKTESQPKAKVESKTNRGYYNYNENGAQNNNNGDGIQSNAPKLSLTDFVIGISVIFFLAYIFKCL
ncbi:hypothetical protein Moror_5944 [Moniliophthora roreri MCA 2997]|uniref:Uncharacterized protein n=2 Tax=Moniliophthora roreri TaxID=221103 RepID=V2WYV1_MONRO|nr:hypothetical protein Moror_5944 [Moniliophthora roreri MCA 2997]